MESKEYFEKVMQDYNQHRNGRSLRKYCKDEAIDYDWVIKFNEGQRGSGDRYLNHLYTNKKWHVQQESIQEILYW